MAATSATSTTSPIPIPADAGRSWWLTEALAHPEFAGEPAPALAGDTTADVVILGGGYTGMWTAYHLKRLDPGVDVVILEQDICGGGPSGRNGGFVNSYWGDLPQLVSRVRRHGRDSRCARPARRACRRSARSATSTASTPGSRNDGDLNAAASDAQVGAWGDLIITADRLGLAEDFKVMGSAEECGRWSIRPCSGRRLSRYGASVQPARLARGLRRVLMEHGRAHPRAHAR